MWICCAWAFHVYMTYDAGITRHLGMFRRFFSTFINKIIRISNRNESFLQITLGSGSKVSQNHVPFHFLTFFFFSLLTCVNLSKFSCFKISRWGFFVWFWANFGIICNFSAFLLSAWRRSVNLFCLSNECLHDIVGKNNQACGHVKKVFSIFINKIIRISNRNESF